MDTMTPEEAEALLVWAEGLNPGAWTKHSRIVADAAGRIARECGLDPDAAYVMGLLHDIGRYNGVHDLRHVYDGFALMMEKKCPGVAQICLTHSFPSKDIGEYAGRNDCDEHAYAVLCRMLEECRYSDYDLLIQLCDSLSLPDGVCLMEKRLVDVARRYGVNEHMVRKWEVLFDLLRYFDGRVGAKVYSLFPEVVNNTFC